MKTLLNESLFRVSESTLSKPLLLCCFMVPLLDLGRFSLSVCSDSTKPIDKHVFEVSGAILSKPLSLDCSIAPSLILNMFLLANLVKSKKSLYYTYDSHFIKNRIFKLFKPLFVHIKRVFQSRDMSIQIM